MTLKSQSIGAQQTSDRSAGSNLLWYAHEKDELLENDSVLELRISEFNQNFEEQKLDEHEINIEDLIDQMEANNFNRKTALYSGSPISIYEACVRLINLTQLLNVDKSKTQILLQEIRYFFPTDCRLSKTVFKLFEITNNINISRVSTHCVKCGAILIKSNEKTCSPNCSHNGQHRSYGKIAELTIMNIEYEAQRAAGHYVDLINDYLIYVKQLVPCDIINGKVHRDLPNDGNHPNITIILYGDNAPIVTVNMCLQVNSMYNMNIESCLRKILSQIDDEYKMHLRSLCFCVPTAEDETIKILQTMISDEELLINYRIKRERD
ncbi:unnamed protein product [Rotaria sordida]|uniref:Uncharacterized protein n=1 Tax=Rotaria sordida TaxID=392033 RepID=A0A819V1V1_9BILA|nr:unnamed protein product [Rotaria sordida]